MSFAEGDFVTGLDEAGRSCAGVALTSGVEGWVTLVPPERNDSGVWVQAPTVRVRAESCSVVEAGATRLQSKQLRDWERGWRAKARENDQTRAERLDQLLAEARARRSGRDRA